MSYRQKLRYLRSLDYFLPSWRSPTLPKIGDHNFYLTHKKKEKNSEKQRGWPRWNEGWQVNDRMIRGNQWPEYTWRSGLNLTHFPDPYVICRPSIRAPQHPWTLFTWQMIQKKNLTMILKQWGTQNCLVFFQNGNYMQTVIPCRPKKRSLRGRGCNSDTLSFLKVHDWPLWESSEQKKGGKNKSQGGVFEPHSYMPVFK